MHAQMIVSPPWRAGIILYGQNVLVGGRAKAARQSFEHGQSMRKHFGKQMLNNLSYATSTTKQTTHEVTVDRAVA
jgi:hypothetical protein